MVRTRYPAPKPSAEWLAMTPEERHADTMRALAEGQRWAKRDGEKSARDLFLALAAFGVALYFAARWVF